jgi:hypothetical protein
MKLIGTENPQVSKLAELCSKPDHNPYGPQYASLYYNVMHYALDYCQKFKAI